MKRILLTAVLLGLAVVVSFAQSKVSGRITDGETGEPLQGVTILIKGTTIGVYSDADGNYSIQTTPNTETLLFTFIGKKTLEEAINGRSTINVTLQPADVTTEEVVVTGYRTFTEEKSSVAVSKVDAKTISNRPNPSLVQTLSGQIPGVNIQTNSGQPGGNSNVLIRGISSINGDIEPLFVIDGAPVDQDNFRSLNPNEIQSVTVLKDAAATAIYGNRGANGVIVIETKNGKFESPLEVTYTYSRLSNQLQANDYDLMNAEEQLLLENQRGSGFGATLTEAEIAAYASPDSFTDWPNFFFQQAIGHNHNLQFRKGGKNSTSYFSVGYLNNEGILKSSSLQRISLRSNLTGRSNNKKFQYSANFSVNFSTNNEPNNIGGSGINRNLVLSAYQSVPYIRPDQYVDGRTLLSPLSFANTPLFMIDLLETFTRREDETRLIGTVNASYEIIDGLKIGYRASGDFTNEYRIRAEGPESFNALLFANGGRNNNLTPGFQDLDYLRVFLFNQVINLSYDKTFGDHSISAGIFTEYFRAFQDGFGVFSQGLNPKTFAPGDGSGYVADASSNDWWTDEANAFVDRSGLFSYFGQADYDYATRYGVTATLRRDASSRFAATNRWGTFWSVAGRWNIHNEKFAQSLPFDILKLRASYGTNGNQFVAGGSYFTGLNLTRSLYRTGGAYGGANGLFLAQLPNTDLRWETVAQGNIGLDFEVFNGRLGGSVDAYVKTTSDLFLDLPISSVNYFTSLRANVGSLQNRGVEIALNYDLFDGVQLNGLQINVYAQGALNVQEVLDLGSIGGEPREEIVAAGLRVGGKFSEYFRYRYAGVNPENGQLLFLDSEGNETETPNVDTDRVWLDQNIYPDWQGAFGINIDFQGFYVNTQFNYAVGADRLDFDYSGFVNPGNIGQFRHSRDILDAWTPDNTDGSIPSLDATNLALGGASTRFLTNADYIRLRFVNFGYALPKSILSKLKMRELSVFASGENLITITEWRGFDVEAQSNTSRLYPTPRTWTLGVQIGL